MAYKLDVWGRGSSSNVQKVLWLCAELGLDPVRHNAGGSFGGLDTPEFLAMNPNATVPVIKDDAITLWESQAILRYLANRHAEECDMATLYPTDPVARAPIDMWLDWYPNNFWPPIRTFFRGYWQNDDVSWDDPDIVAAREAFVRVTGIVTDRMQGQDYVTGDTFTLADIPIAIGVNRVKSMHLDLDLPERLENWFSRVSARPAFAIGTAEESV